MSEAQRIFGFHPVREALRQAPQGVVRVWVAGHRSGSRVEEILGLCRDAGVEVLRSPLADLDRLAAGVHNGFVAEVQRAERRETDGDPDLVLLLEDVQDPRNLGAILRVCDGAGVGRVLVRDRGSAPLSAAAVKSSAGAAESVPVERIPNTARAIEQLRAAGYWVYGGAEGGEPPWEVDLSGKVVLCLGGEEKGLRPRTLALCDRIVGLPMRGRVSSLNVASAGAAMLYEAVRQRTQGR